MANATSIPRQAAAPMSMALPNFAAYAGILPAEVLRAKKAFFGYEADFLPLAISAVNTVVQIQIDADSAFLAVAANRIYASNADVPIATPAIATIQIVDTGSGRQFFSVATHIDNVCGTAANPFYWPYPQLLNANSTLNVTLTNLEATARNYRILLIGFKLYGIRV